MSSNEKGFSMGEVILSVFILGVTMVTILSLYTVGLKDFHDERDSIIASMLAQEGVEIARNIRDNNWARREGVNNDTGIGTFDKFDVAAGSMQDDCRVDFNSYSMSGGEIVYAGISCADASRVLNVNGGFYTHSGGTPTKFRRTLKLDYRSGDDLIVTSFVSWNNSNPPTDVAACKVSNKCVFSESTLRDWGTGV